VTPLHLDLTHDASLEALHQRFATLKDRVVEA
jgi:hypothetical protein